MEKYENMLNKAKIICEELENKERILCNLKNNIILKAILDVVNGELSLYKMKEIGFPVVINVENAILYAYELSSIKKYFMVVWKDKILDCVIMEYEISPAAMKIGQDIIATNDKSILEIYKDSNEDEKIALNAADSAKASEVAAEAALYLSSKGNE
tara:strand:- start:584 stop:1051 length:468 start_codon:yes stop_codon:yes gene_type:complete